VHIDAALPLQYRQNELTFLLYYPSTHNRGEGVVKKSYWITASQPAKQQWALVVGIDNQLSPLRTFATNDANAVAHFLAESGTKVSLITDQRATTDNINNAVTSIAHQARSRDSVLLYLSGSGFSDPDTGEPYLQTAGSSEGKDLGNLNFEEFLWKLRALDIPSLTIIVDASFKPDSGVRSKSVPTGALEQASPVEQSSASWIYPLLHHKDASILLSSRFDEASFVDGATDHGLMTKHLLDILAAGNGQCIPIRELSKQLEIEMQQEEVSQHPLFFSTAGNDACLGGTASPRDSSDSSVSIMPTARTVPLLFGFDRKSPEIRMELPSSSRLKEQQTSPSSSFRLMFIVGDPASDTAAYQISRNGVVLRRESVSPNPLSASRQVVTWVPLEEGENIISIQVDDALNRFAEVRMSVTHPIERAYKAVVIGVDKYQDSAIQPLHSAAADASAVRAALLSFTEIEPRDIYLLTGENATRDSIKEALETNSSKGGKSNTTKPSDPTLLFYFSGYGSGVVGSGSSDSSDRCVVPFDAQIATMSQNCIRPSELSAWANAGGWKDQIAIIDASYQNDTRRAAYEHQQMLVPAFRSKTLLNVGSFHLTPALSNETQQGRLILAASGANEEAFENDSSGHGLFTEALLLVLGNSVRPNITPMSLQELYSPIAQLTQQWSGGFQTPALNGSLSMPFNFQAVTDRELWDRAAPEVEMAPIDSSSMRVANPDALDAARRLLVKALELRKTNRVSQKSDGTYGRAEGLLGIAIIDTRLAGYYRSLSATASDEPTKLNDAKNATDSAEQALIEAQSISEAILKTEHDLKSQFKTKCLLQNILVAQSLLYLQSERSDDAEKSVRLALTITPRLPITDFAAGKVLASRGAYTEASRLLRDAMKQNDHFFANVDQQVAVEVPLEAVSLWTQEQVASALLWRQVCSAFARGWFMRSPLSWYALTGKKTGHAIREAVNQAGRITGAESTVAGIAEQQALDVDATWGREVSAYLLGLEKEDHLREFQTREQSADPRTADAFKCSLEFYIGFKQVFQRKKKQEAMEHFKTAVKTRHTELLEYWFAKSQLESLAASKP
jgi:uncharacterized caspase-like protein/tetratricopeptide (TPR) repeat protein